jgi:hypothetical protein
MCFDPINEKRKGYLMKETHDVPLDFMLRFWPYHVILYTFSEI